MPVFGTRDTRSLDFTVRGSLTLSSKLSMQLYSQFFVARGRYDNFSILADPDNMVDFPEYPKRRDFNYKNLQSNFVTRWEYRPGSAIYFVWSHSRRMNDEMNPLAPWGESLYEQSLGGQVSDLFRSFPGNSSYDQDRLRVSLKLLKKPTPPAPPGRGARLIRFTVQTTPTANNT